MMDVAEHKKLPLGVVVVFYILGVVTLLPWNFFITAETYWQYKLRNVTAGDAWDDAESTLTPLQISFTPTLVIVSNVVCTAFLIFTTAIVSRVTEFVRLVGSFGFSLAAMVVITLLTFVNTDSWQSGFFSITMLIVALLNICMAIIQGSSYGLAGFFPSSCMSGMVSGQAIAGVFSSFARIVSLLVGEEPLTSGLVFFAIADAFLVISIIGYLYLIRLDYYKEMKSKADKTGPTELQGTKVKSDWATYIAVLKKVWLMGTTLGGTLFVTLMIYPTVVVYVTSIYSESRWTKEFFQPTITFLLFNIADWIGREAPRWIRWPGAKGWLLHVLGLLRLIFIPLLMLCNGENKTFPTVFDHDAYYIVFLFLFALTNGYIGTLAMLYYPLLVDEDELELAGTLMAAMLGIGMVTGSLLSPALVALWGPS